MKYQRSLISKLVVSLLVLAATAPLFAQYKGSLAVAVTTSDGGALPGAVVTLSASTFNRSFVTDANGSVRFVGLTPDSYEMKVTMTGFNTVVRPGINIDTGQNVRLSVVMEPSTQTEELVVTAETPLVDVTQTGAKTVLTTEEIEMIPQARDPWAVLDSIPGLQTDRINIGGNESGQQAQWVGHGDNGDNAAWVIDGVEFTDFAAEGASQSYLDFGSFSQISFQTGGTGSETGSSGTVLNFVTKQGSNQTTGSMRLLFADEKFVSTNVDRDDPQNVNADGSLRQNTVFETFEKGFEIGGPIIKDRLWYWGAFNQNNIKNIVRTGQRDDTDLENISLKLHGDITSTTRATFFYTEGDKLKFGRGAGPSRTQPTTWNQTGPSPIYKFEISQLIGQNTELQAIYGRVDGGFALQPQGGLGTVQALFNNDLGRWENTIRNAVFSRPQRTYVVKGSTFTNFGNSDNEITYGVEYKEATSSFLSTWGEGSGNVWLDQYSNQPSIVRFYRDSNSVTEFESTSAWIQDVVTIGNLTITGGLRFNSSEGNNVGAAINGNPFFPDIVPALAYDGDSPQFTWETIAPRIGVTYTFGDDNQFLVKGSARQYYDNLSVNEIDVINPVGFGFAGAYWNDLNGDGQYQLGEEQFPDPNDPYLISGGINRADPAAAASPDRIDGDLEPPETLEFTFGGDWSITPTFAVGVQFTFRERDNTIWNPTINERTNQPLTTADYEVIGTATGTNPVTGETYNVTQHALRADVYADIPNRVNLLTNRPDYSEEYQGIEFTVTKRMSNRWMLRGHFSFVDWTRSVGQDSLQNPNIGVTRAAEDGSDVVAQSAGSGDKGDVFLGSATYTAYVNGVYQLPWDINVSGSITAREGYAAPLFHRIRSIDGRGFGVTSDLSTGPVDDLRMDDIFLVNAKITKVFRLGNTKVDVAAEVFNIFNDDALLQVGGRQVNNATTFGRVDERLSPRLTRFSASINF